MVLMMFWCFCPVPGAGRCSAALAVLAGPRQLSTTPARALQRCDVTCCGAGEWLRLAAVAKRRNGALRQVCVCLCPFLLIGCSSVVSRCQVFLAASDASRRLHGHGSFRGRAADLQRARSASALLRNCTPNPAARPRSGAHSLLTDAISALRPDPTPLRR